MSPTLDAALRSWPAAPWLLAALLLTAGVYLRGWFLLGRRDPRRWHDGRPAAFLGGLAAIYLALASPIEPFSALAVVVVVVLAAALGPRGPTGPPDPVLPGANPRPEWPFLWLFGLLSLSPPASETFVILVLPVLLIAVLFLVPFLSNSGERAPSRRPVAVLAVIVIVTTLGVLTYQGATSPWSPQMTAWSGDPVPENLVRNSTPMQLQGAAIFQNKDCRNCHALEGSGGKRGPDLTTVGTRLTRNQLIDQVSNGTPGGIQQGDPGGGNMPAFGSQINPAEMAALVAFLESLRPRGEPPAVPGSQRTDEKEYP